MPAPHVLWVAGGEAASTDIITFQVSLSDTILTMFIITALVLVVIILASRGRKPVPGFFQNSQEEHWQQEIDACLYGVMNCCKSVIEPMMERSCGKIVNVASDAGKAGEKLMVSYSAAKAGIMGFTRSLAREMGRYWINVNAVCPGMTKGTGMTAIMTDELEKRFVKNYALRRLGRPEDTTQLILFLSSKAADWITGQAISVNGGYYMGG